MVTAIAALLGVSSCAGEASVDAPLPPAVVEIEVFDPTIILPHTRARIEGRNLASPADHFLRIEGSVGGEPVSETMPLEVEDAVAYWKVSEKDFSLFEEGNFRGTVQVVSRNEWGDVESPMLSLKLRFARQLTPELDDVVDGVVHLNSAVVIEGEGLISGHEGQTYAEIEGCFVSDDDDESCDDGAKIEVSVPVVPVPGSDRTEGTFLFAPNIVGIRPGHFEGTITLRSVHPDGEELTSSTRDVQFDLHGSRLSGFEHDGVSLGQYLEISGLGLTGALEPLNDEDDDGYDAPRPEDQHGATAIIRFNGTFTPNEGADRDVRFDIVPTFVSGERVRYVVEEDRGIGDVLKLRSYVKIEGQDGFAKQEAEPGVLYGSWTLVVRYEGQEYEAEPLDRALEILPLKQVVWVNFTPGWRDGLRLFGLQPAEPLVRERYMDALRIPYEGLNVEFRTERPEDFHLYARIDVGGQDPNDKDTPGLDTSAGKDRNNVRLHDVVGGYNAVSDYSEDAEAYGGIFAEAFMTFSKHPPKGIYRKSWSDPLFDEIFDPFRPDTGRQLTSGELKRMPDLDDADDCPAANRIDQAACAVVVMGNIFGHTTAHEFGHTLGLAQYTEKDFSGAASHNTGRDRPNRLMDPGGSRTQNPDSLKRPFAERAQMNGEGPSVFCKGTYHDYLRVILPDPDNDPDIEREPCFY